MIRILCIIGTLDVGGAETFMMKILRNIDRRQYCIDFLLFTDKNCKYNEEAQQLGAKIYVAPQKSTGFFKTMKAIKNIVRDNNYTTVLKVSEFSMGALDLWAAKKGGAKVLMMRSSNSGTTEGILLKLFHFLFRPISNKIVNVKLAPSTEAALYTFGNKSIKNKEIIYITNGLNLNEYLFDHKQVEHLKKKFNLNGKYVVTHIGRFSEQKNHKYLIKIFQQIKVIKDNAILLLLGEGELKNQIINQVKSLGIQNDVIFLGIKSNVPEYLAVSDVVIFPSLFEGMPNVIVEAQAAGIPCVISNRITKEVQLTGLIKFLPIDIDPKEWAITAVAMKKMSVIDSQKQMKIKGYDINDSIDKIFSLADVGDCK